MRMWGMMQRIAAVSLVGCLVMTPLTGCSRRETGRKHATIRAGSVRSQSQRPTEPPVPSSESATPPTVIEFAPTETERQPIIYDPQAPNYKGDHPEWTTLRFDWECQDNYHTASMDIPLDAEMYRYYRGLQRYYGIENFYLYVNDDNNRAIVRKMVDALRNVADEYSYDDATVAREIAKFVQDCIEYQYDIDGTGQEEYPKYPIETIYERRGDCEDSSILMAALLKEWGYEVGFLHLPHHVAVAIRTSNTYNAGPYYEIDGRRYLFIESTGSGWFIGDIPEDFSNTGAELHLIS